MRFPELRVTRKGAMVARVEWHPCRDGAPAFDITDWKVTVIEKVVTPDGLPEVKVTILARLVEVEEETEVVEETKPG